MTTKQNETVKRTDRLAETILLGVAAYRDVEGRPTNLVLHPDPEEAKRIAEHLSRFIRVNGRGFGAAPELIEGGVYVN
jgi:hypothetical protein